jgi:hypothetical protein
MQQGIVDKTGIFPNLDESESESQGLCEQCQTSPAFFRYEVFSADRLVKGSRCAGCFLDLLRGLPCLER